MESFAGASHGKSFWRHRHFAGAALRLEACATQGGGCGGPRHWILEVVRLNQRQRQQWTAS